MRAKPQTPATTKRQTSSMGGAGVTPYCMLDADLASATDPATPKTIPGSAGRTPRTRISF
jgi:hypothetical protein